jgi:hypothetical protein
MALLFLPCRCLLAFISSMKESFAVLASFSVVKDELIEVGTNHWRIDERHVK